MKRVRMSKKSAYVLFIPLSIIIFSLGWIVFGPFSFGALFTLFLLMVWSKLGLKTFFEFYDEA